jgi:hypothetical protein
MDVSSLGWTFGPAYPFRAIYRPALRGRGQDSDRLSGRTAEPDGPGGAYTTRAPAAKASTAVTMTSTHASALKAVASSIRWYSPGSRMSTS